METQRMFAFYKEGKKASGIVSSSVTARFSREIEEKGLSLHEVIVVHSLDEGETLDEVLNEN